METTIFFSLIFLTSCTVFEAHGARDQIPEETTQTSLTGVSKKHNDGVPSSGHVEDASGDPEDLSPSPFSSFSPLSSFSSFSPLSPSNRFGSFRLGQPFASRPFNGNDPSSFFANSPFDDVRSRLQKLTQTAGLPSNNKNGYLQNGDKFPGNGGALIGANGPNTLTSRRYPSENGVPSVNQDDDFQNDDLPIPPVGAFGGIRLFSQHFPSGKHSVIDSMLNGMQMPTFNGLQPINRGNGNDSRNQQLGNTNPASTKNIKVEKFDSDGIKGFRMQMQETRCCINNKCYTLKAGEVCGFENQTNGKNNKQQSEMSNNPLQHLVSSGSLSDDEDGSLPGFKNPNGQYMFGEHPLSDDTEYILSNDGLDSYKPKSGPLKHPYVKPTGLTEDEAEKIRNSVHKQPNFYRNKHGIPALALNKQLSNYAQDWANTLEKRNTMMHRDSHVYGENIFWGTEIENVGEESVDNFYNEIALYRPGDTEDGIRANNPVQHLTQLLWNGTTMLGVGVSKSRNGQYYIVCNYDPAGNVYPFYKKNLPEITQAQVNEGATQAEESKKKYKPKITYTRNFFQSPVYRR